MPESYVSTANLSQNIHENNSESFIKTRVQMAKEAFHEWSSRTDMKGKYLSTKETFWLK